MKEKIYFDKKYIVLQHMILFQIQIDIVLTRIVPTCINELNWINATEINAIKILYCKCRNASDWLKFVGDDNDKYSKILYVIYLRNIHTPHLEEDIKSKWRFSMDVLKKNKVNITYNMYA